MPPTKQQLRRDMKARRVNMPADEVARASEQIRGHLLGLEQLREAGSVFVYISIRNEPDTHELVRQLLSMGKRISVPRLDADGLMRAHVITSLDDLKPAGPKQYRTLVPPADAPVEPPPGAAVTLVPGLAFTKAGQRLGMGGGHYDRYLADHPTSLAIGLCYAWQLIDDLPHEPHDRPVNLLVTEAAVVSCLG
jgi:5-formyltetrahydrofolate cyclo-ligase